MTRDELLTRYEAGYRNFAFSNLYGANLYGADLRGANLYGADLRGADLCGANLCGADLRGANLYGADLRGADLRGANLSKADLRGANLYGADLRGADLCGANLCGAKLQTKTGDPLELAGRRPVLTIGPIGSRDGILLAFNTDQGIYVHCGCFWDTLDAFAAAVEKTHGDNQHGRDYRNVIMLLRGMWGQPEPERGEGGEE
jgi:hypothetical protein